MAKPTITTNNVPRPIIYGHELSVREAESFDYIDDGDLPTHQFFRYRGEVYDLNEFVRIIPAGAKSPGFGHIDHDGHLKGWDGIHTDSFYSAVVVRYVNDDDDRVVVGTLIA